MGCSSTLPSFCPSSWEKCDLNVLSLGINLIKREDDTEPGRGIGGGQGGGGGAALFNDGDLEEAGAGVGEDKVVEPPGRGRSAWVVLSLAVCAAAAAFPAWKAFARARERALEAGPR